MRLDLTLSAQAAPWLFTRPASLTAPSRSSANGAQTPFSFISNGRSLPSPRGSVWPWNKSCGSPALPIPHNITILQNNHNLPLSNSFHDGLKESEFNRPPFWQFFLLSTYWVFAPSSPWAQLRLRLLKNLFFTIPSTYYLSFYNHIVRLVRINGSVWQKKIKKGHISRIQIRMKRRRQEYTGAHFRAQI